MGVCCSGLTRKQILRPAFWGGEDLGLIPRYHASSVNALALSYIQVPLTAHLCLSNLVMRMPTAQFHTSLALLFNSLL